MPWAAGFLHITDNREESLSKYGAGVLALRPFGVGRQLRHSCIPHLPVFPLPTSLLS